MTESTLVETLIGHLESLEDRSWWFHTALKFERQFPDPPFHIAAVDQQLFLTVTCPRDGEQEQLQIGRVVSHSYGWPFPITSEQKAIFARELTGNPSLKVGDTFRMSMQGLLGRRRQLIENLKHWVRVHDNDQKRKPGPPQDAPTGPSLDRSEILKRLGTLIECLTKTVEMSRFFPPEGELVSLPSFVAQEMAGYLANLMPATISIGGESGLVWPGTWSEVGAEMIRGDLEAAGIPYSDKGSDYDFHALRHQYITDLARAGVSQRSTQQLARHSKPELTANVYTHLSINDIAGDVERLQSNQQRDQMKATGTAGQKFGPVVGPVENGNQDTLRHKPRVVGGGSETQKNAVNPKDYDVFKSSPGRT